MEETSLTFMCTDGILKQICDTTEDLEIGCIRLQRRRQQFYRAPKIRALVHRATKAAKQQ